MERIQNTISQVTLTFLLVAVVALTFFMQDIYKEVRLSNSMLDMIDQTISTKDKVNGD
jgi:hypothetical protein